MHCGILCQFESLCELLDYGSITPRRFVTVLDNDKEIIGVIVRATRIFCLLSPFAFVFSLAYGDSQQKLFDDGKKACIEHKWDKAISRFEKFVDRFPQSQHMDNVQFWLGYSLEKIPERQVEAFKIFGHLIERYSDSVWLDNAIVHQLRLAEQFVGAGQEKYRPILTQRLLDENKEVQYRAAISLGKLGDKQALPTLQRIQEHKDLGRLATALVVFLEQASDSLLANLDAEVERPKSVKSVFASKRYKQYRSMLRKDDGWTNQELVEFGMWHILKSDEFKEYQSLTDEYDRIQWYQDYWQAKARKMELIESELRNEFERRLIFARTFFSAVSDHLDRLYHADQYLLPGQFRAPWDARGELYIKYGEPRTRYQAHWDGLDSEHWDYPNYEIDFIVLQQWTNIYLNAIRNGPTYYGQYENDQMRFERDYIRNAEFRFNTIAKADPFESLSITVSELEHEGKGNVLINYGLNGVELNNVLIDKMRQNILFIGCSVLDKKHRKTLYSGSTRSIISKESPADSVGGKILLALEPGEYIVRLKIQDLCSYKVGFFEHDLVVGN